MTALKETLKEIRPRKRPLSSQQD